MIRGGTTKSTLVVLQNVFERLVYERELKR